MMPGTARAVLNHLIHPSQSVSDIIELDKNIIDDPHVKIRVLDSMEAHPVSPFENSDIPYQLIAKTITQTFGKVFVAPG
jgi:carboxypeptidase PM20D1